MRKSNFIQKLNLGLTVYFGLSTLFASLCGVVGLFIWLYRVWIQKSSFTWFALSGFVLISLVLFVMGIVILKNGFDEAKEENR